jgi:hypothetical protein
MEWLYNTFGRYNEVTPFFWMVEHERSRNLNRLAPSSIDPLIIGCNMEPAPSRIEAQLPRSSMFFF